MSNKRCLLWAHELVQIVVPTAEAIAAGIAVRNALHLASPRAQAASGAKSHKRDDPYYHR